jgi:hypothetical protein
MYCRRRFFSTAAIELLPSVAVLVLFTATAIFLCSTKWMDKYCPDFVLTSLHMTFNIDTHVWDLDYLSARRLALRREYVQDTALGQSREEDNRYVGRVNKLLNEVHEDMMSAFAL